MTASACFVESVQKQKDSAASALGAEDAPPGEQTQATRPKAADDAGACPPATVPPVSVVVSLVSSTLCEVVARALVESGRFAAVSVIAPPPRLPPPPGVGGGPEQVVVAEQGGGTSWPPPSRDAAAAAAAAASFVAAVETAARDQSRLALLMDVAVLQQLVARAVRYD